MTERLKGILGKLARSVADGFVAGRRAAEDRCDASPKTEPAPDPGWSRRADLPDDGLALIDEISLYRDLVTDLKLETEAEGVQDQIDALRSLESSALELYHLRHDVRTGVALLRVAVIGMFSSGKSSFVNSLLGRAVCPVSIRPTTSCVTCFTWNSQPKITLREVDGAERIVHQEEYEQLSQHDAGGSDDPSKHCFAYMYPFPAFRGLEVLDTPGFGNSENPFDEGITRAAADQADVLLLVVDINEGNLKRDTLALLDAIRTNTDHAPCYLILNKADRKPGKARARILTANTEEHRERFERVLLYSSTEALEASAVAVEQQLESAVRQVTGHLRDAVPFELTMRGERSASAYEFQLGEQRHTLNRRLRDDVTDRSAILSLFEELRSRKQWLLGRRVRGQERVHGSLRRRGLASLGRWLRRGIRLAGAETPVPESVRFEPLEKAMAQARAALQAFAGEETLRLVRRMLRVRIVPKKEKSGFWGGRYYKVTSYGRTKSQVSAEGKARLLSELGRILRCVGTEYRLPDMERELGERMPELVAAMEQKAAEGIRMTLMGPVWIISTDEILEDYYGDKEDAKAIVEHLEKDHEAWRLVSEELVGVWEPYLQDLHTRVVASCGVDHGRRLDARRRLEAALSKVEAPCSDGAAE